MDGMDVVDFAYQIIAMNREIEMLKQDVEHLTEIKEQYEESLNMIDNSTKDCIATIFKAVLDPKSSINRK